MMQSPIDETPKKTFIMNDKKSFRFYEIPNKINQINYYPSVTAICGYESDFSKWHDKEKNWREIQLFATTIGTFLHYKIQSFLANKWGIMRPSLEFNEEQQNAFNSWFDTFPYHPQNQENIMGIREATEKIMFLFEDWFYDYKPQLPRQLINGKWDEANLYPFEIKLRSERFGYAGAMDMLLSLNQENKNYLLDIKTTYTDNQKYDLQIMAYCLAFEEMYQNIKIDEIGLLYFAKDTKHYQYKFIRYTQKELGELRLEWLMLIKKFYSAYGDNYPLSFSKDRILQNLATEGI